MNTTFNRFAIGSIVAPAPPDSIAVTSNTNISRGTIYSKFSILLFLIFMLIAIVASPATYYIGPNGSDAANGSITTPFATLNKAWSVVAAGDQIYLRGGTYSFTTQQTLSGKNGTASNFIKVWAYPGETPVIALNAITKGITLTGNYINFKGFEITGLSTLSGWTNAGNGIYSKAVSCESPTNMVTVNGVNTAMGRYPNADAANGGYLSIDSHSGTTTITDAALAAAPVWTGGELVVKREHWTIDREVITNHATHTITYTPFTGAQSWDIHEPVNGYGYFIQNDLDALDQLGEWFYDGTTMYMYFGSYNPTSYEIKTSTVNNIMYINNGNYVTFENMILQGGNASSFKTNNSTYTTLQNSIINFTGGYAVYAYYTGNHNQILNNSISNSNYGAIRMEEGNSYALISGNTITNSGVFPGMGARINLNGIFEAISTYNCSNTIVEHNSIVNTGYNGIHLAGSAGIVRNNFIDTYCFLKDDGGGIYTYGAGDGVKRYIQNNIILNGIGSVPGTTENLPQASGIYSDGYTDNVEISGNSVYKASFDGIYIHNSQRITCRNNTFFDNTRYGISIVFDGSGGSAIRNASVKNNISVAKSTGQRVLEYYTYSSPTDILLFGTTDSNYFINPFDNNPVFRVREYPNGDVLKTFAQWKTYCQQDAHSYLSPTTVPDASYMRFEYNETATNKTIALGGTYIDARGSVYVGSITLLPYTSAVLMLTTTSNNPPSIQNQTFQLNENSPNGTVVGTVVATDPNAGQTLTYSILSGNINSAFAINASSGILTVATTSALNFEVVTSFALVVKVQDNGTGNLSSQATITVNLLNVNEPPVVNNQIFSIPELTPNGTLVGTVVATDPDAGQTKTFVITSGNTSNAFLINSTTGVITVATASSLNFLVNPVFSLDIRVTDNGTGNLFDDATITINLTQSANQPPVIVNQTFQVNENSANGTSVGIVVATDPNAGQTLTYSILSGNTNSAFAINASTGVLSVATTSALNFEAITSFALVVKVQDNGTGNLSSQATVTVTLLNVNEPPVVNNQTFSIPELTTNGTFVGTIVATDPDAGQTKTFTITSGNTGSALSVNATTGAITVATSSALNFLVNPVFNLIVQVTDNGTGNLFDDATITINLIQSTNQPPVILNQSFTVNEHSPDGTIAGTVVASDPNAGQTLNFSIISGNTGNAFAINPSTGTLIIADSAAVNYETLPTYTLVVKVQDNGAGYLSSQAIATEVVLDVNETPIISNENFGISQQATNGTIVGTVLASDLDPGQTLTYSILSGNTNGAFAINPSTGVITVANATAFACSSGTNYSIFPATPSISQNSIGNGASPLEVGMKFFSNIDGYISGLRFYKGDGGQGLHIGNLWSINGTNLATATFTAETASGWQTVTLSTPVAITANTIYVVSYFSQHGDYVKNDPYFTTNMVNGPLTALGWSASQPNGVYKYSSSSAFPDQNAYVGSTNYWADVIFTSSSSSSPSSFVLTVKVQDNGSGNLSSQANMTINVSQQSPNQPPIISNQAFAVNENSTNGTTIGTVVAIDPDAGQSLTFSIMSGNTNSAFTINTSTGILTVANSAALNYESSPSFSLIIKVQDNGSGTLSSTATITISLNNINEYPIVANQTFSVNEFAAKGTIVGTVLASDPDAGQVLSYAITAGNTSTAFSIISSTGKIKVNNRSALNYSINPVFNLTVRVKDNGTGQLASYATITINVIDGKSAYVLNIVSIPQDTITAGLPYNYGVIGYSARGTVMHYSSEELPNWLSFTDNGNGTATIEGIPGNSDLGYHQILVKGFDSLIEVEQSFSIEVKSATISGFPNKSEIGINIFPNPVTNGILNIKLDKGIREQFDLSIWDNSGKLLLNKHYQDANLITLDLSAYPPASYIVKIRSLNIQLSEKFIIL
jgi:parallel beta-helix repeat protein